MADTEWYPYFIVDNTKEGNARYTGYDVNLLDNVAKQLQFTYTLVEIKMNKTIDNWENVLYQAVQRYDLVMSYWTKSLTRMNLYPYVWIEHLSDAFEMVALHPQVPEKRLVDTLFNWAYPFSAELWALLVALLVVQGLIMYHLETECGNTERRPFDYIDKHGNLQTGIAGQTKGIYLFVSMFTGVGGPNPDNIASRLQVLAMGFTCTILLAVIMS